MTIEYKLSKILERPADSRDLLLSIPSTLIKDLPLSKDLRQYSGDIENQLTTGSCVANATVSALEILLQKANKFTHLSRLFVYWNARANYVNMRGKDEGAYLIDGFKSCYTYGVPQESVYPFIVEKVNDEPPLSVYSIAEKTKVQEYTRVGNYVGADRSEAIDFTKAALAMGYPVIIAMHVHSDIFRLSGKLSEPSCKYNKVVSASSEYAGGHAMCLVGYNSTGFIVENSWGTAWGDSGYGIIGYEAMNQACFEAWTCTKFSDIYFKPEWNFPDSGIPMTATLTAISETQYLKPNSPSAIIFPWVNVDVKNGTLPYNILWSCSDPRVEVYVINKSFMGSIFTKNMLPGEVITVKVTCTLKDSTIPTSQQITTNTLIRVRNSPQPTVIKDIDSNYGKAYRLYRVAFNRIPDEAGLAHWESKLDSGMELTDVSAFFISSAEFQKMYGPAVTNRAFMTLLYKNGLRRDADEAGLSWWVSQLDSGAFNKPNVLVGFSESDENKTMTTWW